MSHFTPKPSLLSVAATTRLLFVAVLLALMWLMIKTVAL